MSKGFQGKFIDDNPHFDNDGERRIYIEFFKNLPENYDQFIENKNDAFNLFCRQKLLIDSNKIKQEDAVQFQKISASRGTLQLGTIICSALGIFYLQKGLRYKNIIYGMTYRFTFLSFLFKFYFMPQFIARGFDSAIYQPQEKSLQQPIIDKYDLRDQEFKDLYFKLKATQGFTITQNNNNNDNNSNNNNFNNYRTNNSNTNNNNTFNNNQIQTDNLNFNQQTTSNDINSSSISYNYDNNSQQNYSSQNFDSDNQSNSNNGTGYDRKQFDNTYSSQAQEQQRQDYYKAFRN